MATVDSIDAFSLLQNMAPMSYDSSRLVDVACIAYAHVDDAHIKGLRGEFLPIVQRQFQVAAPPATIHMLVYPEGAVFSSVPFTRNSNLSVRTMQIMQITEPYRGYLQVAGPGMPV